MKESEFLQWLNGKFDFYKVDNKAVSSKAEGLAAVITFEKKVTDDQIAFLQKHWKALNVERKSESEVKVSV